MARVPEAEIGRLKEQVSLAEAVGVVLRRTGADLMTLTGFRQCCSLKTASLLMVTLRGCLVSVADRRRTRTRSAGLAGGLDDQRWAQAIFRLDLLEERGALLGEPYTRQLDGKLRFYRGGQRVRAQLGYGPKSGVDLGSPEMYDIWNNVHTAALEDYGVSGSRSLFPGTGAVNSIHLTDRQVVLLRVVAEGGGDWDARWIDITVDSRYGPGTATVLRELQVLQGMGLVARDDSRSGVGGRWKVTAAAQPYLR